MKPKVSAFINAKFDKIEQLRPDLVLAFSDLQADIAKELIRRGMNVFCFNQRGVAEILDMIRALARILGVEAKGLALAGRLQDGLDRIADAAAKFPKRPRVFFEEWNDPLISGIRWVEELVEIAGGAPIFPELRDKQAAKDRIVTPAQVAERLPDVVIASWCGRKVNKDAIRRRPGWEAVPAVVADRIFEVKSTIILQPGPAALTDGVARLSEIVAQCAG